MNVKHWRVALAAALALMAASATAVAGDESYMIVGEPFVEMRTGPGRGYPAFLAAERGERLLILKRKNSWFKLQAVDGQSGWVNLDALRGGRIAQGEASVAFDRVVDRFQSRRFEGGFLVGELGGAATIGGFAQYNLVPRVGLRVSAGQILGKFSDGWMATGDVVLTPFPDWRISPFFALGSGVVRTSPQTTLVQSESRTDEATHVAAGLKTYITRRFVLHMEFDDYIVLTNRDNNEEHQQWQLGFSVFF